MVMMKAQIVVSFRSALKNNFQNIKIEYLTFLTMYLAMA